MTLTDLDRVKDVVRQSTESVSMRVYLFGSHARGTAGAHSDIDLALDHEGPLPTGFLAELRDRLHELPILCSVDIVDLPCAARALALRIQQEGVLWIG